MARLKNPTTGGRGRARNIKAVGAAFDGQNPNRIALDDQGATLAALLGMLAEVARSDGGRAKENTTQRITCIVGPGHNFRIVKGRLAWCLWELLTAGDNGVTAYGKASPHLSDYIRRLRKEHGIQIKARRERHGGLYPSLHSRYYLISSIQVLRATRGSQ